MTHPTADPTPTALPVPAPSGLSAPFAVWAPRPEKVRLWTRPAATPDAEPVVIDMVRCPDEWWEPAVEVELPADGELDYGYLLDDDPTPRPDPRSLRQPYGVHGPSRTYDPSAYAWQDTTWTGRQLAGSIIYEMHVGTFTPEGTLHAAIDRLDHLVDLGIDTIEVMPVASFNGPHGWGYDGVAWFSVHEEYGGPQAYQAFVDACHVRGLAVIQDVVYNHFGPSGNYLPLFGPYLYEGQDTPWGTPVNLDGPDSDEVADYVVDNMRFWLRDYHVDGLRLDAVHALTDPGRAIDIMERMSVEAEVLSTFVGRPLSLVAESDLNNPRLINPRIAGGYGLAGQWSDDFHHAVVATLTDDSSGYLVDFNSPHVVAKVMEDGFVHDGTYSTFRGRSHGRPLDPATATWRLVVCSANHDQIGNRAAGDRLRTRIDQRSLELAAVLTLTSPFTPMIFMGEEWGASTPWAFFTSHPEPELGAAVAEGRKEEFARVEWDHAEVPNPQDPATFHDSKLDWSELEQEPYAATAALYRHLIALRRGWPDLTDPRLDAISTEVVDDTLVVMERGERIVVLVNLGHEARTFDVDADLLLGTGEVVPGPVRGGEAPAAPTDRLPNEPVEDVPGTRWTVGPRSSAVLARTR